MLAENLAGLLGKALVSRRRRLVTFAARAKPFSEAVSLVQASQQIMVVTDSPHSTDDLDRTGDRKTKVAVGEALIDSDFGQPA